MLFEQPDGIGVVGWRPPAFCRADVLRDIDASLNGGNEGVLHAAQPDGILTALLAGIGFLPEDGSVIGHAPEQPQDAIIVYYGLPAPPFRGQRAGAAGFLRAARLATPGSRSPGSTLMQPGRSVAAGCRRRAGGHRRNGDAGSFGRRTPPGAGRPTVGRMDVISCKRLTKRFGSVVAVSGLDLRVSAGQVYGFLGPNGAGKKNIGI